jgi:hypothetical protein
MGGQVECELSNVCNETKVDLTMHEAAVITQRDFE